MPRPAGLRAIVAFIALTLVACGDSPIDPGPLPPPTQQPPPTPAPPPPVPHLRVTHILAFGDSMTEGATSPPLQLHGMFDRGIPQSYPYKLVDLLATRYTEQQFTVGNAGRSGWRARDLLDVLTDDLRSESPEVVLLMAGANDILGLSATSGAALDAGLQSAVDAVEEMVRRPTERGVPVLLATLPPERPDSPPGVPRRGAGAHLLPRFNAALAAVAAKRGAFLVDVYTKLPLSFVGADGLHLTEEGNQKLAEIWLDALKTRYETASASVSTGSAKQDHAGSAGGGVHPPAVTQGD
jgi:lysophospholipase L1-like esterase